MCTAITLQTKDFYFGRTLDYERSFGAEVVLPHRHFPLPFREQAAPQNKKNAQISTVKMFMYTKIEKLQNKHFTNATTIGTL